MENFKKPHIQPMPGDVYVISHEEREKKRIELYLYALPIPYSVSTFFRKLIERMYDANTVLDKYQLSVKRKDENIGRIFFVGSGDRRLLKADISRTDGKKDRYAVTYRRIEPWVMKLSIFSPYETKHILLSQLSELEEEYKQLIKSRN